MQKEPIAALFLFNGENMLDRDSRKRYNNGCKVKRLYRVVCVWKAKIGLYTGHSCFTGSC